MKCGDTDAPKPKTDDQKPCVSCRNLSLRPLQTTNPPIHNGPGSKTTRDVRETSECSTAGQGRRSKGRRLGGCNFEVFQGPWDA